MSLIAGNNIKVFIEKSDGTLYDLDGMVTNVSMSYSHNEFVEFSINGVSTGAVISHEEIKKKRTDKEWACTYCGRPNQRKDETCKSCGGVRSFLYA